MWFFAKRVDAVCGFRYDGIEKCRDRSIAWCVFVERAIGANAMAEGDMKICEHKNALIMSDSNQGVKSRKAASAIS